MKNNEDRHPCFNLKAKYKYARVHLPIAPDCNIQCNYCSRKFDCVNESRPGVTSVVLSPAQALEYLIKVKKRDEKISVVGIAGPGDAFANPDATLETLRIIREKFHSIIFCLSTNGLNISSYIDELVKLRVAYITITVNAVSADLTGKICSWVRYDKRVYHGINAGSLLLANQLDAISKLKAKGIIVKVNSIILPGINDWHIPEVAKKMAEMKVDIMNCIPVYPNKEANFTDMESPSRELTADIRFRASFSVLQMTHCTRCRADAVGLLGKDDPECLKILKECSREDASSLEEKAYVAVASYEGELVNCHLGEASALRIFAKTDSGYMAVDVRKTPPSGSGDSRWRQVAGIIKDCRALLVSGIGNRPLAVLKDEGVDVIEMSGLIREGLDAVYKGMPLKSIRSRNMFNCGAQCSGTGMGCG